MYTKKDHSKDEYYLAYSLVDLEHENKQRLDCEEQCPLDNNRIKDGYIECKSTGRGNANSDNMQYKCYTLHSIFNGKDIVNYTYGGVGYDFNPESINTFTGCWTDYGTNNELNKIIENKNISENKIGASYYDKNGKVHEKMHKKLINRAKALQEAERKKNTVIDNDNLKDDDSFNGENYVIEKNNEEIYGEQNILHLTNSKDYNKNTIKAAREFLQKYEIGGIPQANNFNLFYDNKEGRKTMYCIISNELNCTARDQTKGIKVDRIFVLEGKLQELQDKQKRGGNYNGIYDRYINKLTDVLIQQFPFGEIRVVKGDIETGQTNEFLSPEEFISEYFVNNNDKEFYLNKLKEIRKSKINNQYDYKQPHNYTYGQKGYQKEGNNCCPNGCICF